MFFMEQLTKSPPSVCCAKICRMNSNLPLVDVNELIVENQALRDWARDLERELWRLHWLEVERRPTVGNSLRVSSFLAGASHPLRGT